MGLYAFTVAMHSCAFACVCAKVFYYLPTHSLTCKSAEVYWALLRRLFWNPCSRAGSKTRTQRPLSTAWSYLSYRPDATTEDASWIQHWTDGSGSSSCHTTNVACGNKLHLYCMNSQWTTEKNACLNVKQSHPLHRIGFGQYQNTAVLEWLKTGTDNNKRSQVAGLIETTLYDGGRSHSEYLTISSCNHTI